MNTNEPTQLISMIDTGRHHQVEDDASRRRQLAIAWQRVDRNARELVRLYQRVRMPMARAFVETSEGRRRERLWFEVWLLSRHEPARRTYLETMNGRACGTTTVPEVLGVALLADGKLYQYRLVKKHPMLTLPLPRAVPDAPPGVEVFEALAARALRRQ